MIGTWGNFVDSNVFRNRLVIWRTKAMNLNERTQVGELPLPSLSSMLVELLRQDRSYSERRAYDRRWSRQWSNILLFAFECLSWCRWPAALDQWFEHLEQTEVISITTISIRSRPPMMVLISEACPGQSTRVICNCLKELSCKCSGISMVNEENPRSNVIPRSWLCGFLSNALVLKQKRFEATGIALLPST